MTAPLRALMIAAPSSGAGKTTLTAALLRAYRRRGVAVAAAKSGPDYIDPAFHAASSGRPCVTLDAWAMAPEQLCDRAGAVDAELLIVEAAMGLLDAAPDAERPLGRGSAADLAAALGAPVVLVVDVARQAQSAIAAPLGFRAARPDLTIAGVILNKVGSPRHEAMTRRAFEAMGVAVLGALPRDPALTTPSRHLGLVQARERSDLEAFLDEAAGIAAKGVDLDRLAALARPLAPGAERSGSDALWRMKPLGQRIAVARDDAFAFAYGHMLEDWRAQGAAILPFSPLADQPPDSAADAVFLPGGYPELHAGALAAAKVFHDGMNAAAARGALIYGECGGYMTLGEGLVDADGARHAMLGLLPLETSFAERRLHLGYRRVEACGGAPIQGAYAAHEFHYAAILSEGAGAPLFHARDSLGAALAPMGRARGRVAGSFAHIITPM